MVVLEATPSQHEEALSLSSSSRMTDRVAVTLDDPILVADAGLIIPATLMVRLGLEASSTIWCACGVESVVHCPAARCSHW
jgi:hypothetical protein